MSQTIPQRFVPGETVRATFTCTDPLTGGAVAPTGVTVRSRRPDGTQTVHSATVTGNVISADIPVPNEPGAIGTWYARAEATGPSPSASPDLPFAVEASRVV